jgi:hypothetical protein
VKAFLTKEIAIKEKIHSKELARQKITTIDVINQKENRKHCQGREISLENSFLLG